MATKSDRSLLHVSEPPDADPPKGLIRITVLYLERHVRWCGERERKAPVYPIVRSLLIVLGLMSGAESIEKELFQSLICLGWILAAIKYRMYESYVIFNSVVNRKRESLC